MIHLAVGILWLAIGVIVLGGVIYLGLLAVRQFVPIDPRIEKAVWLIFLILILIYVLSLLGGGSAFPGFGTFR